MPALEGFKVGLELIREGFGVVHLLQHGHAGVVLGPFALHLVHGPGLGLAKLRRDHRARCVEHSLEDREHVQGVPFVLELAPLGVILTVDIE